MPKQSNEQRRLWIVAGPNGSGKSTAYGRGDVVGFDGSVWIINPDLLTARIQEAENQDLQDANLLAVQRIELWLEASINAHQTIGVETVLSTDKYRRLLELAKSIGFEICFIYVFLDSAELQIDRIRARVKKGGHNVPDDRVRSRRTKSFDQMPWFFWRSDRAWVFNNSLSEPKLVAQKTYDKAMFDSDRLDDELLEKIMAADGP